MPNRPPILVVEDDNALRYAMTRELTAAGYEVTDAPDYRDALEMIEKGERFAVLIVDLVLPVVNGFALARMARMRQHDLKVVYMTAFDNVPANEAHGPILHKPIASEVLLAAVANALDGVSHAET